jgi:Kinesin motor domain
MNCSTQCSGATPCQGAWALALQGTRRRAGTGARLAETEDVVCRSVSGKPTPGTRRYEYDSVLGEEATQAQVYAEVRELIQSAHDGFNVCVFCYGQTGSGKTYTMRGEEGSIGILPRAAADIFAGVGDRVSLDVEACVLELYQDNLVDLLADPSAPRKLTVRSDEGVRHTPPPPCAAECGACMNPCMQLPHAARAHTADAVCFRWPASLHALSCRAALCLSAS